MSRPFLSNTSITDDRAIGGQIIQGSTIFQGARYLKKNFSSEGNRRRFTISVWCKRNITGTYVAFMGPYADNSNRDTFRIDNNDRLEFQSTGNSSNCKTVSRFRDTNAWYNFMVAVDITRTLQVDRIKFYVNGELQTHSENSYAHNIQLKFNDNVDHYVGCRGLSGGPDLEFNGYLSQFYYVDGAALDPSHFGYTDFQTGIWRPKKFDTNVNSNYTYGSSTSTSPSGTWTASGNGWGSHPPSHIFDDDYSNYMNNNAGGQIITWNTTSYNLRGKLEIECRSSSGLYDIYVNGNSTKVADTPSGSDYYMVDCGTHDQINEIQFAGTTYNTGTGLGSAGIYVRGIYVDGIQLKNGATHDFGKNGFYFPLDGSDNLSKDMSSNNNHFTPNVFSATVPFVRAKGGPLPILNTNKGGTTARLGVRPDPLASNLVLACPLSDRSRAGGFDVHHLITGSGSAHTLAPDGVSVKTDSKNFYGSSGSTSFDGSNDHIDIPSSTDFDIGTGDFTCEAYVKLNSGAGGRTSCVVFNKSAPGATSNSSFYFGCGNNGASLYLSTSGNSWTTWIEVAQDMIDSNYHHIVWQRTSNILQIYIDGVKQTAYAANQNNTIAQDVFTSTRQCNIGTQDAQGSMFNGEIQDLRFYKGVAKYSDDFLVGSTHSAVVPDSPSGIAVSRKFEPSSSGSVSFEGTTSYLEIPNHSDLEVTDQDFCFEAFIYPTGTSNNGFGYLFNKGFHNQITFRNNNNDPQMEAYFASAGSGSYDIAAGFASGNNSVPLHQWSHVALTRSSGTLKWFINGKEKASQSAGTLGTNSTNFSIGTYLPSASNYEFKGGISNVRITVGEAVYTSNFTPSSEPLTLTSQGVTSSNVKLLCCKDKLDSTVAEKIPTGSITRSNSAYSTATSPFGDDTISRAGGYSVINVLLHRKAGSVSDGNLFLDNANYTQQKANIIFGPGNITTGKYYWEIDYLDGTYGQYAGITANFDQGAGEIASQANKSYTGSQYYKIFNQTGGVSFTEQGPGTVSFALDVDNQIFTAYYNNNVIFIDTTIPNASTTQYAPFIFSTNDGASGSIWKDSHFNFGQRPFRFTPPDGYETISIANIPHIPKIIKPEKFFHTFQYTGNGGSSKTIDDLPFKPDLIWQKNISTSYHNRIWDSVRGWNSSLYTNRLNQEDNYYDYGVVRSIGPGHVTLEQWRHSNFLANLNGQSYINWAWKAGTPEVPTSGSVYFDANGDYLSLASTSDFDFGTGDFTLELYFKCEGYSNTPYLLEFRTSGGAESGSIVFYVTSSGNITFWYAGADRILSNNTITLRKWTHVALVRSSGTTKMYVDGVVQTSTYSDSNDYGDGGRPLFIGVRRNSGSSLNNQSWNGQISNVRIVKGTAVYTSNFTPSTTPLTNITNTKLLCCQSTTSATTAAVTPGTISTGGNVGTDISQNPFDAFSIDGIGYTTASAATAATSSNLTAGNISISQASVNTKAGFSIIMYTGSGGQGNIPHGLLQDPDMVVVKGITNNNSHWQTYHSSFGTGSTVNRVYWSSNSSSDASATNMFKINPGAGTILLNTGDHYFNSASHQYIMYCWHSVPGYSKFDQYFGNGQSSDGKFVYTGFRPAFVFLKRTSGSGNNWEQRDNVRNPYNPADSRLFANTTDTPSVGEGVDFLSNGFKVRNGGNGSNANDQTYLYMAIAEQPLTSPFGTQSNAR